MAQICIYVYIYFSLSGPFLTGTLGGDLHFPQKAASLTLSWKVFGPEALAFVRNRTSLRGLQPAIPDLRTKVRLADLW